MIVKTSHADGCYLCGTDTGVEVFREEPFQARQCSCGLVYAWPAPADGEVDPRVDHHHRVYYSQPAALRANWLRRHLPHGRVLDIGCGEGEFAQAALARGYEVEGIDPSEPRALIAERRTGICVHRGLIEDDALAPQSYDGVFHVDLLSHFPDPVASLKAIHHALKPGGMMCFEVGLFAGLSPGWRKLAGRGNMPAHRWFYEEGSLRALLDRAGFELVEMKYFSIGLSTAITSLGLKLFRPREISDGATMLHRPVVRGRLGGLYYRAQMW